KASISRTLTQNAKYSPGRDRASGKSFENDRTAASRSKCVDAGGLAVALFERHPSCLVRLVLQPTRSLDHECQTLPSLGDRDTCEKPDKRGSQRLQASGATR